MYFCFAAPTKEKFTSVQDFLEEIQERINESFEVFKATVSFKDFKHNMIDIKTLKFSVDCKNDVVDLALSDSIHFTEEERHKFNEAIMRNAYLFSSGRKC